MKRLEWWKLSLLNVFASPVRSLLTVLGIAIGIGAILAVITLGEAGQVQVRSEMTRLGIDKVWLTAQDGGLRMGDGEWLGGVLGVQAAEAVYLPSSVCFGADEEQLAAVGCTQTYLDMCGASLVQGRHLHALEWEADGRSLLLGAEAARRLRAVPGDVVVLHGIPFVVAGLVEGGDAFGRTDASLSAFLPVRVLCDIMGDSIQEIMLDVPRGAQPQTLADEAQRALAIRRDIAAEAVTLQVQMEAADSVIAIFVDVLRWVAFVCMLVGGIGVMNILLVSVRERRREIGVMKSLGATYGQICTLFLLEALLYALIGGALGVCMGLGLISMAGAAIGLAARAKAADCLTVLAFSMLTGLFFGVAPASRAAGMKCVDALRQE